MFTLVNQKTMSENKADKIIKSPAVDVAECQCTCQGECQCGNKYKRIRPVYYEVDVNQIIESLNDWD
jgi:hypothetical protein